MPLSLMEGNEAVAWGAMASGCRFFAGYPITPATTIFNTLLKVMPPAGGICLQGEDEIASIGYCLGASMAGLKSMTATSGPGISLYSEQISFAIGSEIPIVIVNVQRLGPSTGSATRGADGDINFMRWGNSGGLPVIVLAPVDIKDCFLLTMHAFNLAEEYRCPVFLASNKEIAMTKESIDLNALENPPVIDRIQSKEESFQPFAVKEGGSVPEFLPIGSRTLVRQTSSTHGADGYITTDSGVISEFQNRLKNKLESAIDSFSFHESLTEENRDTLIITYGVTGRAAKVVFGEQKKAGKPISLLILKTLWPVPENLIRKHAENAKNVFVFEMNMGQYIYEIKRILPDKKVNFFGQMDGRLITPRQIMEVIGNE
ncbi:MAG: pyruvate flavodoxin/ferredoxin oxidoreductase [Desulfobacteraceae bacterium]|nr:MAG: pyruvate flavodoxin/ferredoxin oxidoreductase [Desulfobacteraceae bacterium]